MAQIDTFVGTITCYEEKTPKVLKEMYRILRNGARETLKVNGYQQVGEIRYKFKVVDYDPLFPAIMGKYEVDGIKKTESIDFITGEIVYD